MTAPPPKRIRWFVETILGRTIYDYQETIADAVLDSVINGHGYTFTCMLARQMGKNETSAFIESYILFAYEQGSLVKCAPTWVPQVNNSRIRLLKMMEAPLLRDRFWKSMGYIIGLAPSPELRDVQAGTKIFFFSAGPDSSIVGATASLLLEIDEAQDVAQSKFDVELRPMASTTNATTILWGTAWSSDTLLARQIEHNKELEEQDGIRRHFEFDWRTLAAINPKYKKFVEGEIRRLGEDSISIRTQFRLLPISGAGLLFNEIQRHLLKGVHSWLDAPVEDEFYIAGMDVGGEERPTPGQEEKANAKRDSTIITIGRVSYNELDLPKIEVVHNYWFTGMKYSDQYATTIELMQQWNIRKIVIDKTGLGAGIASLLVDKFGDERVIGFNFSRPSKSALTFQLLAMVNSGRLKIYEQDKAPAEIYNECWKQLKLARYSIPSEGMIAMRVDANEGHDDFLLSIALCTEAIREILTQVQEAKVVKPRRLYSGESRY